MDRESEFEKPYRDRDYRAMHLEIPAPDWPSLKVPEITPWQLGALPYGEGVWYCNFLWGDPWGSCEDGFFWIEAGNISIYAGRQEPPDLLGAEQKGLGTIVLDLDWNSPRTPIGDYIEEYPERAMVGTLPDSWKWWIEDVESGKVEVVDSEFNQATLKIDTEEDVETVFTIGASYDVGFFLQPFAGADWMLWDRTTCKSWHEVRLDCRDECCDEEDYLAPSWDEDTSAETIDQSDEVTVAVNDGCGPFTWSVSGTGFSLDSTETEDRTNLLIADSGACGPAEITVTDDCGEIVTGYVLGTEGEWVRIVDEFCSEMIEQGVPGNCCSQSSTVIIGKYRYIDHWMGGPYPCRVEVENAYCDKWEYTESQVGECCHYTGYYPCFDTNWLGHHYLDEWKCP